MNILIDIENPLHHIIQGVNNFIKGLLRVLDGRQATVLCGATRQLSLFNFQQYKMDWQTGTRSRFDVAFMLWHMAAKRFGWRIQKILRFFFFKQPLITYQASVLTSGDLVQVRSKEEIKGLLDRNCKTQGLLFAHAMWKYCGKQFQVFEKVERTIIEETGAFRKMSDTFLLKDVTGDGKAFGGARGVVFGFGRELG